MLLFVVLARMMGPAIRAGSTGLPPFASTDLPIFASMIGQGGPLARGDHRDLPRGRNSQAAPLRATPLRPHTILAAHVIVKLLFTALTLVLMIQAGRRYYPVDADVPLASFGVALLFTTTIIVSLGFVMASIVPTARFAQPVGSLIIYPMLSVSGLFAPVEALPAAAQAVSESCPSRMPCRCAAGIWRGEGWLHHAGDVAVLVLMFLVSMVLSARVFRWE